MKARRGRGVEWCKCICESGAGGSVVRGPMKIIAYNYRGLGNRPAFRILLKLQKAKVIAILFLSETKLKEQKIRNFIWLLGLTICLTQEGDGQGGRDCCFLVKWH
jgi:hypothetical protein